MISISEKKREMALNTIMNPSRPRPPIPPLSEEYLAYSSLADKETVEMKPVEGFPWKIYVVRAHNRREKCPVFVSVHGGGWIAPHMRNDDLFSAYLADRIGGIVVDVDYTTTREAAYPVCFDECYEAARYAVEHCEAWGGDPQRVGMGGYSAGGHLTAAVCLKAAKSGDFRLAFQALVYPPLEQAINPLYKPDGFTYVISPERSAAFNTLLYGDDPDMEMDPYISAIYAQDEWLSEMPSTLIISAGKCNFRYENEDYAQRLGELGVEVTYCRFPEDPHGFLPHLMGNWKKACHLLARQIKTTYLEV